MYTIIKLYSDIKGEINRFLNSFYNNSIKIENPLLWTNYYSNPIEMAEIIGTYIDNNDFFKINMWISIDIGIFINVTNNNANEIIKYLYERFPY